jgi:SnoaL-like domain
VLEASDRFSIHELLALYGHLIDERRWDDLGLVFCLDAIYDFTDFGEGITTSLEELVALWTREGARHPLAHHATNIVVTEGSDGTVEVVSKGIAVGTNGRVSSILYRDTVTRTRAGWRIATRTATLRQ